MSNAGPAVDARVDSDIAPFDFEHLYRSAAGDSSVIPWSDGHPNPAMVTWLDVIGPGLLRSGCRVAVVGCGLGEDARELIRRGYDVTAFDSSQTAVEWARRLDPANAQSYQVADLLELPAALAHRFDLVVEIYTLQSMPPAWRQEMMNGLSSLLNSRGHLLVICREELPDEPRSDEPPWPVSSQDLVSLASASGLAIDGSLDSFDDDQDPPVRRLRGLFHNA